MGHLIFLALHLAALLFVLPALFVTIPLHVLFAWRGAAPATATAGAEGFTWPCPFCREQIKRGSTVCRWCRMPVSDDDSVNEAVKARMARGERILPIVPDSESDRPQS